MIELDDGVPGRGLTPVCAIGASAGGVTALQNLFASVDPRLGLAYVVIVHLAPDHPSALGEILAGRTPMPVRQVDDAPTLEPDCVYVIPPDRELVIHGNEVTSRPFTEPRGRRAPIDMFFRSVATARGDGFAIVLSGAGSDGAQGVRKIKEAGGVVFVQDPGEAEYPMMPRSAIATGCADFVTPIDQLVQRLAEVSRSKEALRRLSEEDAASDLRQIIRLLAARTGHDFSSYKRATVLRRVTRRMQVTRQGSLADYALYLGETPEEAQELFADLLISVTMFFRDHAAFDVLQEKAIAALFEALEPDQPVRAWVAGCATGEEAYSLAILLIEESARRRLNPAIQIFATDLDEGALAMAREGRFPRSIEADVSEERLRRFFTEEGLHYCVGKQVRDLVLFATHSALKDPPFMRIDLVSCRNLLIYLQRDLQRQLLAVFHYALRPNGFLFLGSAENIDPAAELFAAVDRSARLYQARPRPRVDLPVPGRSPGSFAHVLPPRRPTREEEARSMSGVHAAALEENAPPSAVVDEQQRLLHLSDTASRFLLPSRGALSPELPLLVRPELRVDLKNALHRALDGRSATLTLPVSVAFEEMRRRVAMQVAPLGAAETTPKRAVVFFLDGGPVEQHADEPGQRPAGTDDTGHLRDELAVAYERLSESRRQHENAIQDLRIANEELQSTNEEYRSTAEELETSKEELQSINEELQTVNGELKAKLESVSLAHSDLRNLIAAADIGTLFLDADLQIKLFTPKVTELFNVTDADIGRSITHFTHRLAYEGVEEDAAQVLRDLVPVEKEVRSRDGRSLLMRVGPYRTIDDRINGVVLGFIDVTARREAEAKYGTLFERMVEGFIFAEVLFDDERRPVDVRYLDANPAAKAMVGFELSGGRLSEIMPDHDPQWLDIPARVAVTGESARIEIYSRRRARWFELVVSRIEAARVAILFQDTTARKRDEDSLREARDLLAMATAASQLGWMTWNFAAGTAFYDERARRMLGLSADRASGADWLSCLHPDDQRSARQAINASMATGEPFDMEFRVAPAEDAGQRMIHASGAFQPASDAPVRGAALVRDITSLKEQEKEREALIAELNHRVKNMLTVVQSIAWQTQRASDDPELFADAFQRRIQALSRTHDLLTRRGWSRTDLRELAGEALTSFSADGDGRVRLEGPSVELAANASISFAMALHELGTNAMKYGALSTPSGWIEVSWRIGPPAGSGNGALLHFDWSERGGPPVGPPAHRGFGRRLLEQGVARELNGRVSLEYREEGLVCQMELPIDGKISTY